MKGDVLAGVPPQVRRRIRKRTAWPAELLARLLGCHRTTVHRHFPGRGPVPTHRILSAIAQRTRTGQP